MSPRMFSSSSHNNLADLNLFLIEWLWIRANNHKQEQCFHNKLGVLWNAVFNLIRNGPQTSPVLGIIPLMFSGVQLALILVLHVVQILALRILLGHLKTTKLFHLYLD